MLVPLRVKLQVSVLVLGMVGAVSSVAMASTLDLVDNGSAANGLAVYETEVDTVGIKITAAPAGAVLTWEAGDGLGIKSTAGYEWDEIEGKEILTVSFDEPVFISSVVLTDLFYEKSNYTSSWYLEEGQYQLADGTVGQIKALVSQPTGTNGMLTLAVNTTTTSIGFSAPGYTDKLNSWCGTKYNEDNEFALGKINFDKTTPPSGVPELNGRSPFGAVGLLVGGIFAACSRRRKRAG
ncbi:MAG: hypothetical protein JW940_24505 [Polyangiaceae bacterium]|nr:hypothetical protein [Polyangiaceae bacterium]